MREKDWGIGDESEGLWKNRRGSEKEEQNGQGLRKARLKGVDKEG